MRYKSIGFLQDRVRLGATVVLVAVVLLASWMGDASGGYFVGDWTPVVFVVAAVAAVASLAGVMRGTGSTWHTIALAFFAAYAAWTALSITWSPNKGDAWVGTGQTLLYLLMFGLAAVLLARGASRRWVLAASVLGPSVVAVLTLTALVPRIEEMFEDDRLVGSVGYYNGEAAFLLVPFWVAVYLGGSPATNPLVRGLVLGGATVCLEVATLTQSRGALVAMAVSLPVFFLLSGQRLRGLLALAPIAAALYFAFPGLNEVYLAFLNDGDPAGALERAVPVVWGTAGGVGLYGLLWGLADGFWKPPVLAVRAFGGVVLAALLVLVVLGGGAFGERYGNPVTYASEKWEAFKTNDTAGQEQSRYLSASGSGRYTLWRVAWQDFVAHPVLGVGTHNYEATYYKLRERSVGYIRQPHMLPLEVLAERGLVGGVLFFGFLAVSLGAGLRQRFWRLNAEGKAMVGAVVSAVSYWFVHSGAEWFWQMPAVTLPAVVYLAVLTAPWRGVEGSPSGWPSRLGVAAGTVALAVSVAPLYIADHYLQRSYAADSPAEGLAYTERAQTFNPVNAKLPLWEAELAFLNGDPARAEAAYRRGIQLNPDHYAPYELLAAQYDETGKRKEASIMYGEALSRNPLSPELQRRAAMSRTPSSRPSSLPPSVYPSGNTLVQH